MRWIAAGLACATLVSAAPASAFVIPRWNAGTEVRRTSMLGKWRAITYRKQQSPVVTEPGITVTFERTVMWIERAGTSVRLGYRVIEQEGDLLELEVIDGKGRLQAIDVLLEGGNALTLYAQDDDGDDDEVIRLERVR